MKPKSQVEQKAAERQIQYLGEALDAASKSDGYWLNASCKCYPKFYPTGPDVSPFNALIMALHSDRNGFKSNLYSTFGNLRKNGTPVKESERGVPFNWYVWDKYVNRNNPDDKISREDYLKLDVEAKKQYKGIHNREIRVLFNLDQTVVSEKEDEHFDKALERFGALQVRGHLEENEKQIHKDVKAFQQAVAQNLVPIKRDGASFARYNTKQDTVLMPSEKNYAHYEDYVQEMVRGVIRATGHTERLAREGMVMHGGTIPSQEMLKREEMIVEIASAVKMMEFGLPAKLSKVGQLQVEDWKRDLRENPCLIDILESEVNNALEVVRKAQKGEKIPYATMRNRQLTSELQERKRPMVSSEEKVILTDIICKSGMKIDDRNFDSPEEKRAFMEKFGMTYYHEKFEEAMKMTTHEDPEVAEQAYTDAFRYAAYIDEVAREYKFDAQEQGTKEINDEICKYVKKEDREFVVILDNEKHRADVIIPEGAFMGGKVILPDGIKRNFFISPDEVMSEAERQEAGAKVKYLEEPGFSKQRISRALEKEGIEMVRFFHPEGIAGLRVNDRYFENKEVHVATMNNWSLDKVCRFDLTGPLERSKQMSFDKISMVRDDNNRWLLYIAPQNEQAFGIYPDKADINQFFTASRQGNGRETENIRRDLANKYYAMSKVDPNLKMNIFGVPADQKDLEKIQKVNIYKTKDDHYMCAPILEGVDEIKPREISQGQWDRLWLAEDRAEYKRNLAANLFGDVLHQEQQLEQEVKNAVGGEQQPVEQKVQVEEVRSRGMHR